LKCLHEFNAAYINYNIPIEHFELASDVWACMPILMFHRVFHPLFEVGKLRKYLLYFYSIPWFLAFLIRFPPGPSWQIQILHHTKHLIFY